MSYVPVSIPNPGRCKLFPFPERVAGDSLYAPEIDLSRIRNSHFLFLVDQLEALGGGERMMLRIAERLQQIGARVSIITFRNPISKEVHFKPVHVFEIERVASWHGLKAALQLRSWMRKESVDLAQTFFVSADLFGGLIAKLARVPVLISNRRDMGLLRTARHQKLYRRIAPLFHGTITVCDAIRKQVIKEDRIQENRIRTIYNGVLSDPKTLSLSDEGIRILQEAGIPLGAPLVLSVAHILPWKGHKTFVHMAREVASQIPDAHFLIAGRIADTKLEAELRDLCEEFHLTSRVHFLGNVKEPRSLMQLVDVFCLLSDNEGMPNALLEAMASGLPVVASQVGGVGEILSNPNLGSMVPAGDFAAAASHVCAYLRSPELSYRTGQLALQHVQSRFSFENMMQELLEYYDELLSEHHKS